MNEATIITFANQKGGVGKTTLCTLFANYLVARGKRTIVIDRLSSRSARLTTRSTATLKSRIRYRLSTLPTQRM